MASISIPEFKTPKTALIESSQPIITEQQQAALIDEIKSLLIEKKAVLVAHYYVDAAIQTLAQTTGGHVADSLEMARFGKDHEAEMIVVAGVRFMGETAKILTPEKKIIMPTLDAECSLDLGCPAEQFIPFCDAHPDHTVVVYANTSAEVKARADYVATSGIAVKLVQSLTEQGKKILWGPDKHLGAYVQKLSGADMLIWPGACVVHEEFKTRSLGDLLSKHPNAAVLVHPESPDEMIEAADAVGSTSQLINAAKTLPHDTFIVATDKGIFHVMQQQAPDKKFIPAPTHGEGATCTSCAHCPWMAMNHLQNLRDCLRDESNEITLDPIVQKAALKSTERMLEFTAD